MTTDTPQVGLIMGSQSDWRTMRLAADMLDKLNVCYEQQVVSAHRTPDKLMEYAASAQSRGIQVIIAAAGGAAHLPGMVAAKTSLPVIGVPIQSKTLNGVDSLLSIVQMPAGVPVLTMSIGDSGAKNSALAAASILALKDEDIAASLNMFRQAQTQKVLDHPNPAGDS
ncbi:N5-carboxyaminoimidazole ribonucleotide mutase [Marinicella pacifica]|jgi:5-(carboxyamino)imidazole ribonucleotide mutase|uniref:N5-carboxyaminoimidazole ribonucleotide mutase n=1 Tax=Marinicella pacifica TaxID=1171543 RepID=A0A917FLP5_9GAMM|nr:5-(carboxyamino)imidazole ribonucleotide mutase [Marinicella pacifica]GGF91316.1 N5-carboxyaminoimidazole ribonucleotide mutase [Marinicella pacifica]